MLENGLFQPVEQERPGTAKAGVSSTCFSVLHRTQAYEKDHDIRPTLELVFNEYKVLKKNVYSIL